MRGKLSADAEVEAGARITPAHAGKTPRSQLFLVGLPDHPRACGENRRRNPSFLPHRGSPPRMRGKLFSTLRLTCFPRITPAHAGKTGSGLSGRCGSADHPRACGENGAAREEHQDLRGSPPRMRGKLLCSCLRLSAVRITPAHAGKTRKARQACHDYLDHPRACGENGARFLLARVPGGSPPRMRGKRRSSSPAAMQTRITPAHAGKTYKRKQFYSSTTDHPRACGENSSSSCSSISHCGSPPRMRGKPA